MGVEHFEYHGQQWRRQRATPLREFCVAGDLAQTTDFTACAVLEYQRTPLGEFTEDHRHRFLTERCRETFDVVHLERLPRDTPYPAQAQYFANLLMRSPLREFDAPLIIDSTGVGRAVAD